MVLIHLKVFQFIFGLCCRLKGFLLFWGNLTCSCERSGLLGELSPFTSVSLQWSLSCGERSAGCRTTGKQESSPSAVSPRWPHLNCTWSWSCTHELEAFFRWLGFVPLLTFLWPKAEMTTGLFKMKFWLVCLRVRRKGLWASGAAAWRGAEEEDHAERCAAVHPGWQSLSAVAQQTGSNVSLKWWSGALLFFNTLPLRFILFL